MAESPRQKQEDLETVTDEDIKLVRKKLVACCSSKKPATSEDCANSRFLPSQFKTSLLARRFPGLRDMPDEQIKQMIVADRTATGQKQDDPRQNRTSPSMCAFAIQTQELHAACTMTSMQANTNAAIRNHRDRLHAAATQEVVAAHQPAATFRAHQPCSSQGFYQAAMARGRAPRSAIHQARHARKSMASPMPTGARQSFRAAGLQPPWQTTALPQQTPTNHLPVNNLHHSSLCPPCDLPQQNSLGLGSPYDSHTQDFRTDKRSDAAKTVAPFVPSCASQVGG